MHNPVLMSDPARTLPATVPRHLAVIMDGNGRWAQQRGLPRPAGHREGVKAARRLVEACTERGIEVLTLFAFSSENWKRPAAEVSLLMELFRSVLRTEAERLYRNNVRLRLIGERSALPEKLQYQVRLVEARTAANTGLTLAVAVNYGGRWDLLQAIRRLLAEARDRGLDPEELDPERLRQYLSLGDLPEPDLFIRTGGEHRISNFLLWQLAYTELYFTDRLWPDFEAADLDAALDDFAARQRRFGMTAEQVGRIGNA
jgi:undecaprenyl diphosphate synthase